MCPGTPSPSPPFLPNAVVFISPYAYCWRQLNYQRVTCNLCRWANDKFPGQGLLPTRLNRNKGSFAGMRTYTMGANADSYYEYLLKMWLLKQQKVMPPVCYCPNSRHHFPGGVVLEDSMDNMSKSLLD